MLNTLLLIDKQITAVINGLLPHNLFFDYFFAFFSQKGSSILIWVVIFLLLVIFEEKRDKHFIIYFILSVAVSAFLTNILLKNVFHRPRPVIVYGQGSALSLQTCPADFSFPSGHATIAFAAASVLSAFDKKRKYFYYLIAVLVALSRIYLSCHYFFDIVAGALLGYAVSKILSRFHRLAIVNR
jgi:undecaprenyl-diphosphatase